VLEVHVTGWAIGAGDLPAAGGDHPTGVLTGQAGFVGVVVFALGVVCAHTPSVPDTVQGVQHNDTQMCKILTMTAVAVTNPQTDPAWEFTVYIPGHPMPKGSTSSIPIRNGNRTRWIDVDKEEVREWVGVVAVYALAERRRREARGDRSFPYAAAMRLNVLFVFERPTNQPTGPPIIAQGRPQKDGTKPAIGDLDKLVRSIGDALPDDKRYPNISLGPRGERKQPKAQVIADDRLITEIVARKAFTDEVNGPAGCHLTLSAVNRQVTV
jgi:hypothetical protein